MADVVTFQLTGFDELEQKLREQTQQVAKRTLRRAAKDAADIWVNAISERAPELTGFLKAHIGMNSVAHGGEEGSLQVVVGPMKNAFYAIFSEFGTKKQKAKPFMRPAFEATRDEVLDRFAADLRDELNSLEK